MKRLLLCIACLFALTFVSSRAAIIEVAPAGAWGVLGISGGTPPAGGGGTAELTGTPTALTFNQNIDPAAQDVTVPSDATAVFIFWSFWDNEDGTGISTITLESVAYDEMYEITSLASNYIPALGVAAWYNPGTGADQTVDLAWTSALNEGPNVFVVYAKGVNTSGWRHAIGNNDDSGPSATVNTNSSDLVLKIDKRYGDTAPGTSAGWTSKQIHEANVSSSARLSQCDSPGAATTVAGVEDESDSGVVAISIAPE